MDLEYYTRPMNVIDVAAVHEIETKAHLTPWSDNVILYCVMTGYNCTLLCTRSILGEMIIGFYISRREENDSHLLNICIDPRFQNRGLGQKLLNIYLRDAKIKGFQEALLEVRPSNHHAVRLYERSGFQRIHKKPQYYLDEKGTEDALVYALNLSQWNDDEVNNNSADHNRT